jgi:hypothetical protein
MSEHNESAGWYRESTATLQTNCHLGIFKQGVLNAIFIHF